MGMVKLGSENRWLLPPHSSAVLAVDRVLDGWGRVAWWGCACARLHTLPLELVHAPLCQQVEIDVSESLCEELEMVESSCESNKVNF